MKCNKYNTKSGKEIRLWQGDCMELMQQDKEWNLAIVDPPYGIDLANMNMGVGKSAKASKIQNREWEPKDWDQQKPNVDYFDRLFSITGDQIIWGGNYFPLPPCDKYLIWDKEIPEGLSFSDCEMAWTSFSGAQKMFRYSAYLDKKGKFHPTQKPVYLYRWLLTNYANEDDFILDTHGGSMSLAIACYMEDFELDIIELDEDYYRDAVQRFEEHISQKVLF